MPTFTIIRKHNPKFEPNPVGEFLRDEFFNQEKGLGCYYSFDVKDGVEFIGTSFVDPDEEIGFKWKIYRKYIGSIDKYVLMRYYWDGDGILEFVINGCKLYNEDCKKTNSWEYDDEIVSDSFGLLSMPYCMKCGGKRIVIRPGDIRCSECEN